MRSFTHRFMICEFHYSHDAYEVCVGSHLSMYPVLASTYPYFLKDLCIHICRSLPQQHLLPHHIQRSCPLYYMIRFYWGDQYHSTCLRFASSICTMHTNCSTTASVTDATISPTISIRASYKKSCADKYCCPYN